MTDPYAALRDRLWHSSAPPVASNDEDYTMIDWHSSEFTREQSQRLAHTRPLVGMDEPPFMTTKEWLVCIAAIVGFVLVAFVL